MIAATRQNSAKTLTGPRPSTAQSRAEGRPPFKKTESARLRKIDHDQYEGDSTDGEVTDRDEDESDRSTERASNWAGGRGQHIGQIGLSTPSYDSIETLCPQARCIIMFKYDDMFSVATGEADTGSQFSIMTVDFTKKCGMKYFRCNAKDVFKLSDLSGTRVDLIGYIDLQINTVSGEDYKWTRVKETSSSSEEST